MKIDFVVPWVNGEDPLWLAERKKYIDTPLVKNDYRDWDIFKYWFRAVEQFAPWVHRIYLITFGHLPSFLDVSHPKLRIVNHSDYIPRQYLPTFSSHVIELNLHRIEGLSEHFVYFNDDTFIINPVEEKDFFKDLLPTATAFVNPVAPARYDTICNVMVNNTGVINSHFKKNDVIKKNLFKWFNYKYGVYNLLNLFFLPWSRFLGFYEDHQPTAFLKTTFEELWEKEAGVLDQTCQNKQRNFKTDVNQWLFKNWQIAKGNFYPKKKSLAKFIVIEKESDLKNLRPYLFSERFKLLCLNDHVKSDSANIDFIMHQLQDQLGRKFNEKSDFEK